MLLLSKKGGQLVAAEMNRLQGAGYARPVTFLPIALGWKWAASPVSVLNPFYSSICVSDCLALHLRGQG